VILPEFQYLAPKSLEEACSTLAKLDVQARAIAGGTDVLVKMKDGAWAPRYLVGLRNIPHLDYIEKDAGTLRLGAMTKLNEIAFSPLIKQNLGFLAGAAHNMATNQIRNRGTVGGNVCNAAPSADMAPPLMILGCKATIAGLVSRRTVELNDFFVGPGKSILKAGELMVEIQAPLEAEGWGYSYSKLSLRGTHDIAAVGVAAAVKVTDAGVCEDCRIVLGAVAPTPMRARKTEDLVRGEKLTDALLARVALMSCQEAAPISDMRCSASYRTQMVVVMARRALQQAFEQAKRRK
jgi:carbon-monoxide dehydrogenase medium subunit